MHQVLCIALYQTCPDNYNELHLHKDGPYAYLQIVDTFRKVLKQHNMDVRPNSLPK